MPVDFLKHLTPEQRQRVEERRAWHEKAEAEARAMTPAELVKAAQYTQANAMMPQQYTPGERVYDAHLYHVILPELVHRVADSTLQGDLAAVPQEERDAAMKAMARVFKLLANAGMAEGMRLRHNANGSITISAEDPATTVNRILNAPEW